MAGEKASLDTIFCAAIDIDAKDKRAAYLARACGDDQELRGRVEKLLDAHFQAGSFLEEPIQAVRPRATEAGASSSAKLQGSAALAEGPGTRIGPYKLLQQLGEGGMGIVYMAEQEQPVRRKVALKIIKPGMDSAQVIARFEAERQALALMDHLNIARVLDAGATVSGRPYFVMELVHGVPITRYCDDNRLTPRERLELFIPVCQAIQHAHQKGIIHRDIKPSNVMVCLYDGKPVPKVIDFGVAKAIEQRLTERTLFTQYGTIVGTFEYMAPEQAELSQLGVDTRSDLYALGVLLYELLTGSTPLEHKRLQEAAYNEIVRLIKEEEPPRPSRRLSSSGAALATISEQRRTEPAKLTKLVRGELDWIVMKCLEKDRTRRYETASGLARDLQHYLADEPVEACPPSAGYRLRKFARRYRMPVAVAAAFILLLVAGVVVSAWQAVRARRAEAEAVVQRDLAADAEREATKKRLEAEAAQVRANTAEAKAKEEAERASRQAYAANIRLMQQAWDSHNMLQLQDLLAETADFPERGFEWYYWQRQCHVEHLMILGHAAGLLAVAFAPDGQRLVTGGKDGTARVWDATSGRELWCLRGHRNHVTAVAFAPSGRWLVTGSLDGTARVWDAARGRELRTLQNPRNSSIRAVAVTPDGRRVVTASDDGTARVWDAVSGKEVLTLDGHTALPGIGASIVGLLSSPQAQGPILAASTLYPGRTRHTGPVWAVAVTPDGKRLITAGYDNLVMFWDAGRGRQLRSFQGNFDEPNPGISSVAVSPDGKWLLTAGHDNAARVWDADTGRKLFSIFRATGWVVSVAVTPDGYRIAAGAGAAKIWEMTALPDIAASLVGLRISPHAPGPLLAAPALYFETMGAREILTLMGHRKAVTSVAVSPDGRRLATASSDGMARVWDVATGRRTWTLSGHSGAVSSIAVTPDAQRIVTGSWDGTARVWDMANRRQSLLLTGHTDRIDSVAVTRDGRRIITGAHDATARIWDAVTGHRLQTLHVDTLAARTLAVTPDGQRLVTGAWPMAQLWDLRSGRKLRNLKESTSIVMSVAVTPDGQRVATGCWNDRTTRLWDITSGQQLVKYQEPTGYVTSIAFTPDGKRLITGRSDGGATVWETATGLGLFFLKGHTDFISSIAVTPDGQRILTGSTDGTARLWDAVRGRELLTLNAHAGAVRSVAVTPDGRRLLTGSEDGTVKIWEAATPAQTALWTSQQEEFERQWAAWQRPSAGTPGFIQDWLVLAPVGLPKDVSAAESLEGEQHPEEAKIKPRAGDAVRVSGRESTWQPCHQMEPILDFNRFVGKVSEHSVAYAFCYLNSAAERNDLLLQVGSDDMAKVYLNGKEVYKDSGTHAFEALDPIGPVSLRKGTNVLVFKVVNETEGWECCARFVDRDGNPAEGLQVRLTPE